MTKRRRDNSIKFFRVSFEELIYGVDLNILWALWNLSMKNPSLLFLFILPPTTRYPRKSYLFFKWRFMFVEGNSFELNNRQHVISVFLEQESGPVHFNSHNTLFSTFTHSTSTETLNPFSFEILSMRFLLRDFDRDSKPSCKELFCLLLWVHLSREKDIFLLFRQHLK